MLPSQVNSMKTTSLRLYLLLYLSVILLLSFIIYKQVLLLPTADDDHASDFTETPKFAITFCAVFILVFLVDSWRKYRKLKRYRHSR